MRRYSAPAVADIPDTASLEDVVFTRAGTEPGSVMLRRLTDSGQWQDVTTSVFRDEVTTLARGIVGAGLAAKLVQDVLPRLLCRLLPVREARFLESTH